MGIMGSFPSSTADQSRCPVAPFYIIERMTASPLPFLQYCPPAPAWVYLDVYLILLTAHFFPAPLNFSLPTACPSLLACISSLSPAGMDVIPRGMWPTGLCRTWVCNSGEPLMLNAKQEKTISHHLAAQGGKSWVFAGCSVCLDVQTAYQMKNRGQTFRLHVPFPYSLCLGDVCSACGLNKYLS